MARELVPYNAQAEASLLGACLLSSDAIEKVSRIVNLSDFYSPSHQCIYEAILHLWKEGDPVDPVTVSAELRKSGNLDRIGGSSTLVSLQSQTPAISNATRYAKTVVEMATYRRALKISMDLSEKCKNMDGDPSDLVEQAREQLASIIVQIGDVPEDLYVLDDYLDRPESEMPSWCVPGMLRVGWRAMIVAAEGVGKTVLFRQIAIAAAQGIHPLTFDEIEPCRALIVDLENPQDSVVSVCNPIRAEARGIVADGYDPDRAWLWHRPSGINLRQRSDRIAFETVLSHVKPDLVCLGPLYKAYEVNARENDELAAREVMAVFDDLRERYKFGLLLEHHAPKETAGAKRKLMPYGSSLWLRWPEIGLNLYSEVRDSFDTLTVGRWRGDRLDNDWPIRIHRSQPWPWTGEYEGQNYAPPNIGGYGYNDAGYGEDEEEFPGGQPF